MSEAGSTSTQSGAPVHEVDQLRIDRGSGIARRRRFWPWVMFLLIVGTLGGLLFMAFGQALLLPQVRTGLVTRNSATEGRVRTTASGYVVARTRAAISSRLAGRLEKLLVDVGDHVEQGQLLGQLGQEDLRAGVMQMRAHAAEREQDVATLECQKKVAEAAVLSANRRLEQARLAVTTQETRVTEAERVLELETRLATTGAGSDDDRDRARFLRDVAHRLLDNARAEVATAEAEVQRTATEVEAIAPQLGAAKAAVQAAAAAIARAEALRADADILAPFAGVVLRKEAEVGEMVSPVNSAGSTTRGAIVTLADFESLEMEVDVIERDIGGVEAGLPCRIVLDSRKGSPYLGRVRQVVPTADRTRGTVQVKVTFEALDEHVLPEMSGRVEFLEPDAANAALAADRITVPAAAMTERGARRGVLQIEGEALRFVPVELAATYPSDDGRLLVESGLRGGESVVLDPTAELADGVTVRIVEDAAQ